ncbi:hypothetical protein PLESTF_000635300 [Pleodorina starrii]|nr:hypothetical protein PLESTF_000635300 [Pleodorina starrii]
MTRKNKNKQPIVPKPIPRDQRSEGEGSGSGSGPGAGRDPAEDGGSRSAERKQQQQQQRQVQKQRRQPQKDTGAQRSRSRTQQDGAIEVADSEDAANKEMLVQLITSIIDKQEKKSKAKGNTKDCLASGEIDPVLSAAVCMTPSTTLEGHKQMYKTHRLLMKNVLQALDACDMRKAVHYVKTALAVASICLDTAENLGPRPGCSLNAMLKYANSRLMDCLLEPEAVAYNATAANAVYEAVRTEGGRNGGGGGNRRGGCGDHGRKREHDDSREREYKCDDYKRGGGARYDDRPRVQRSF